MIERRLRPRVIEALDDTRVVVMLGARQVGKSTLVQAVATSGRPRRDVSGPCSGAEDEYRSRQRTTAEHCVPNSDPDPAEVTSTSPHQDLRIWLYSAFSGLLGRPTEPKATG